MTDNPQHASDPPRSALDRDPHRVESTVVAFLRERVESAGADGVVVAMSGGLDSTVTATLAVEALGPDRVLGLGLPCHKTDASAAMEAAAVADHLGIEFRRTQLRPLLHQFEQHLVPELTPDEEPGPTPTPDRALENAIARLRMVCAYYAANRMNRLVVGTANRSELLLGYVTKYGDAAADLFPLGGLYKTEVRELGSHLGLPKPIVEKRPSAGLFPGRTDADELGATYDVIDPLLRRVVDEGESVGVATQSLDIEPDTAQRLISMCAETAHKRAMPPVAEVADRSRRPAPDDAE
jgi:NAD+ synthase